MAPPRPRLPVAREGWPYIAPALGLGLLAAPLSRRLASASLLAAAILAAFFRDPERRAPRAPELLYAPADGRVLHVDRIDGPAFVGGPAWRVAIFLSLLDVHITRSPAAGVVRFREQRPGAFRSAWDPGVELSNEHTAVGIETARGPVLVVQIAGLIARRIVTYPQPGAAVGQGERIGLIKFGSRTDLIFSAEAARPLARPGQRVRGAITPLAAFS